jgi:zinc transport system substrate-binding protein
MSSLVTRLRVPACATVASVLVAGCGMATGDEAGEGREVVASFYPLAWVTERVAGDDWTVSNLTAPGGEPHDLELSIDATARLAGADLVVYLDGFQPAVDEAVDTTAEGDTLDAAEVVDLAEVADHSEPDHADEAHEKDGEGDEHAHGDLDPHFWQDPERMALLAEAVAEELGRLDEAGAEQYAANAEDLVTELEALDQAYEEGLRDCERDVVVVSHDAFGYLAKYGLHLEPIAGLTPDAEPTPAALAELGDLIRDEGITTVFSERLASPAMAETLASDLDVDTAVLDPVEGLTDQTAEEDYVSLMRANLAALQEANGC